MKQLQAGMAFAEHSTGVVMDMRRDQGQHEVLLVEDHEGARKAMAQLLAMYGFKVLPAATVAEGLAQLDRQEFLILDLHLPDGLSLSILRRAKEKNSRIKVAVCSGSTDPALLRAVQCEHPDRIFSKPLNFGELRDWMISSIHPA